MICYSSLEMKQLITNYLQLAAQQTVDLVFDLLPAPYPSMDQLAQAKIVAHRGAYGPGKNENKLPALLDCVSQKIWAVELDLRWTQDQVPVLLHDQNSLRTYGVALQPDQLSWFELKRRLPDLPNLEQVVEKVSPHCHLFIECKEPLTIEREEILLQLLKPMNPIEHFHLLTLKPSLLQKIERIPKAALVLVSEVNPRSVSDFVLQNNWGGVAGHYMLQSDAMLRAHHRVGQKVGVGFITSFNNLCRQVERQADWIFSNHALRLQQSLSDHLDRRH